MQVELENMNIGNVGYSLVVDLSEEALGAAAREGVARVTQGPVATEWEKGAIALTFPGCKERKDIEKAIDDGKLPAFTYADGHPKAGQRRPFTRTDIPFTPEIAALFERCAKAAVIVVSYNDKNEALKTDLGVKTVVTTEYEGAAAAVPKYARVKDFIRGYLAANGGKLSTGEPRTAASFAENRELEAPTEPWDEDTVFLAAANEWFVENIVKKAGQKD